MSLRMSLLTVVTLVWSAGSAAHADCQTTVFDRAGAWRAFGGRCDDGRQKCGVSTSGSGKYFSLDFFNGDTTLTVQLGSADWRVNNGEKIPVTMQIDRQSPWRAPLRLAIEMTRYIANMTDNFRRMARFHGWMPLENS